jgi:hypothetical protein
MDPAELSPATLMEFVRKAMEIADAAIKSGDKAQYATNLVLLQIAESSMTEEEKVLCRAIVNTGILKGIFTLVIDGTKGKLDINKVKRSWKTCCPSLCGKPERDPEPAPAPAPAPEPTPAPETVLEAAVEPPVEEAAAGPAATGSPAASSRV